jgi:hypothetical protein
MSFGSQRNTFRIGREEKRHAGFVLAQSAASAAQLHTVTIRAEPATHQIDAYRRLCPYQQVCRWTIRRAQNVPFWVTPLTRDALIAAEADVPGRHRKCPVEAEPVIFAVG